MWPQPQGRAVRLLVEDALDDGGGLGGAGNGGVGYSNCPNAPPGRRGLAT
jgi:hypothetical protein